jgi:heme-degrading monooxygenase HmoA
MTSKVSILALATVCSLLLAWQMTTAQPTATKPGKVLRHIVLYKFKDEVKEPEIQEVINTFSELPKKIDGIVGFEHGPNVSTEGKSEGLTYCFVVSFESEAARDKYLKHPAHDEYVKVVKDRREKVVVFDYWADR